MLTKLLLLFILVPAIELILLVQIGQSIGTVPTIGLIVFTGALGAFLARRQGVQVFARMRTSLVCVPKSEQVSCQLTQFSMV